MGHRRLARARTGSVSLLSIGVVAALGCSAPAARQNTSAARPPIASTSTVELPPGLAAAFARVVRLPGMAHAEGHGDSPESFAHPETTASDEELGEARALAADCAREIAVWRRGRAPRAERGIEITGLSWPYNGSWTPEAAQKKCEDVASLVDAAQTRRARRVENDATRARWVALAEGDRGDLLRRYGLPNDADTGNRPHDRIWVYTRSVNRSPCTITYYFQRDMIERIEAEPATCLTATPR